MNYSWEILDYREGRWGERNSFSSNIERKARAMIFINIFNLSVKSFASTAREWRVKTQLIVAHHVHVTKLFEPGLNQQTGKNEDKRFTVAPFELFISSFSAKVDVRPRKMSISIVQRAIRLLSSKAHLMATHSTKVRNNSLNFLLEKMLRSSEMLSSSCWRRWKIKNNIMELPSVFLLRCLRATFRNSCRYKQCFCKKT